jgi:methylenetetrahydrofolate dehydrogenase (NADP+) / methenyltetrahydrofolate cyclohydrolase
MSAHPINGRAVAKRIDEETRESLDALDFRPGLGVVLVGDDPASKLYVNLKEKACQRLGLNFMRTELPSDATSDEVLQAVKALNDSDIVHGIIVQLPLPDGLNADEIVAAIAPDKDADGFHPANRERLSVPPVLPHAVLELLRETDQTLTNKTTVVLANSEIFFDQLARTLKTEGIDALLTAPNDLAALAQADILIVAVGEPNLIRGEHVKPDSIIIDIGTTRIGNQTIGDVNQESVAEIVGWITPVPGGVGPVTVALLINNVVKLASQSRTTQVDS